MTEGREPLVFAQYPGTASGFWQAAVLLALAAVLAFGTIAGLGAVALFASIVVAGGAAALTIVEHGWAREVAIDSVGVVIRRWWAVPQRVSWPDIRPIGRLGLAALEGGMGLFLDQAAVLHAVRRYVGLAQDDGVQHEPELAARISRIRRELPFEWHCALCGKVERADKQLLAMQWCAALALAGLWSYSPATHLAAGGAAGLLALAVLTRRLAAIVLAFRTAFIEGNEAGLAWRRGSRCYTSGWEEIVGILDIAEWTARLRTMGAPLLGGSSGRTRAVLVATTHGDLLVLADCPLVDLFLPERFVDNDGSGDRLAK